MSSSVIPAEDWPPYRWLWTNVVLARDPETGEPTPYTHGVRRNTVVWLPLFVLVALRLAWDDEARLTKLGGPDWRSILALALGLLAGHFWW